jgi:hypothetical protein
MPASSRGVGLPRPRRQMPSCGRGKPTPLLLSPKDREPTKKARLCRRVERRRPIFPGGCPPSIVGAERLNCRVRDGNGCVPFAIVTAPPACTGESSSYSNAGRLLACFPGGDEGIRTPDLCRAKAALFQLSYIPVWRDTSAPTRH